MSIFHAIILGITQGLSEYLPISSSGHLVLVPWLFGWNDFDDDSLKKSFDVALHLGTFVAVLGYFRRDVATYVREGTKLLVTSCLLYTSPSPRDQRGSRMPSSA